MNERAKGSSTVPKAVEQTDSWTTLPSSDDPKFSNGCILYNTVVVS